MSKDNSLSETMLNCIKVLEMVSVLHQRGYERLRIEPGMAPSGMYWRCGITHAGNMDPENGALSLSGFNDENVPYTSAMRNRFFDWDDAPGLDAAQLAARFIEEHPGLCVLCRGKDPDYVAWYGLMLSLARKGGLPSAYDDEWGLDDELPRWLSTMGESDGELPMPPLGDL